MFGTLSLLSLSKRVLPLGCLLLLQILLALNVLEYLATSKYVALYHLTMTEYLTIQLKYESEAVYFILSIYCFSYSLCNRICKISPLQLTAGPHRLLLVRKENVLAQIWALNWPKMRFLAHIS